MAKYFLALGRSLNKNKKLIAYFLVLILLITGEYFLLIKLKKADSSAAPGTKPAITTKVGDKDNTDNKDNAVETTNQDTASPDVSSPKDQTLTAADYYNQGLQASSKKDYSNAIALFSKAIELDLKQPDYYQKKAEAEVLSGDKNTAIQTVKDGLINNPSDILLQNKLNILQTIVK